MRLPFLITVLVAVLIAGALFAATGKAAEPTTAQARAEARAEPRAAAPASLGPDEAIAPFVDERTLLVLRVDLAEVDFKAIEAALGQSVREGRRPNREGDRWPDKERDQCLEQLHETFGPLLERRDALRKAGARRFYLMLNMADEEASGRGTWESPRTEYPVAVVVSFDPGADAEAVGKALRWHQSVFYRTTVVGQTVVYGYQEIVEAMLHRKAVARPELAEALAAGPGPIRLALIRDEPGIQHVVEKWPEVPRVLGGGDTSKLLGGFRWLGAGSAATPHPAFKVTIQCKDGESAKNLLEVIRPAFEMLPWDRPEVGQALMPKPVGAGGDQLIIDVDSGTLKHLIQPFAIMFLLPIDRELRGLASREQMAEVARWLYQYRSENDVDWPKDLQSLEKYAGSRQRLEKMLTSPTDPTRKPAYVYLHPPIPGPHEREIFLYEAGDGGEFLNVVMSGTGATEMRRDEFKELMKKAGR